MWTLVDNSSKTEFVLTLFYLKDFWMPEELHVARIPQNNVRNVFLNNWGPPEQTGSYWEQPSNLSLKQ